MSEEGAGGAGALTCRLVDVISQSLVRGKGDSFERKGREWAGSVVGACVAEGRPIEMAVTAFPFKANRTMGRLPDFGEKYSLFCLDALCVTLGTLYPPGGRVMHERN